MLVRGHDRGQITGAVDTTKNQVYAVSMENDTTYTYLDNAVTAILHGDSGPIGKYPDVPNFVNALVTQLRRNHLVVVHEEG